MRVRGAGASGGGVVILDPSNDAGFLEQLAQVVPGPLWTDLVLVPVLILLALGMAAMNWFSK